METQWIGYLTVWEPCFWVWSLAARLGIGSDLSEVRDSNSAGGIKRCKHKRVAISDGTRDMDRQSQKGGDHSQQIQVMGDLHQGLTVNDVREVTELVAKQVVAAEFAKVADEIAKRRIDELSERIIPRLDSLDRLDAFGDPAFQVSLRKANIGAASTERTDDYDILAGLLEERATKGEDRKVRAGLNRAIEIVDQVDDEALAGLTLLQCINLYPEAGGVAEGLAVLDRLFEQLLREPLPTGSDWLDHLDTLGAIRLTPNFGITHYEHLLGSYVDGYTAPGMERSVFESDSSVADMPGGNKLQVVDHELKPGYVRLSFSSFKSFEKIFAKFSPEIEKRALELAKHPWGLSVTDESLIPRFAEEIDAQPNLQKLRAWWNQIPSACQVTAAGRLLAKSNAGRLDSEKLLPEWDSEHL